MTAAHQTSIERHHVEQSAEAELLLQQPPHGSPFRPQQMWIEKQLARVESRLTMNIHRASIVRRLPVIEPEGIREPSIGVGQGDQLAGTLVAEMNLIALVAVENAGHAFNSEQHVTHTRSIDIVSDIDVGELMIANGEGA